MTRNTFTGQNMPIQGLPAIPRNQSNNVPMLPQDRVEDLNALKRSFKTPTSLDSPIIKPIGGGNVPVSPTDQVSAVSIPPRDINRGIQERVVESEEIISEPEKVDVGSLHEILFTPSKELDNDSLASLAVKPFVKKQIDKAKKEMEVSSKELENELFSLQNIGMKTLGFNPEDELNLASTGGLIGMAAGGKFRGRVPGDGHGMEDNVFMPIRDQRQQIGTLAVSPKEYVVDAHTMSALGNGNADEGADVMDKVVRNVREQAYGTEKQPNEISGLAALRPMIERV